MKEEYEFEMYVLFIYIKINMILMYKIYNVIIIFEREKKIKEISIFFYVFLI